MLNNVIAFSVMECMMVYFSSGKNKSLHLFLFMGIYLQGGWYGEGVELSMIYISVSSPHKQKWLGVWLKSHLNQFIFQRYRLYKISIIFFLLLEDIIFQGYGN